MSKLRKVLILGASGFIGRNLKEQFEGKYNLLTPTHKELDLLNEVDVKKYLQTHTVDTIINCAVVGIYKKGEINNCSVMLSNLRMFFNLTNNKQYYNKMIFLNSGAYYNKNNPLKKVKEDSNVLMPEDMYEFHKYICVKFIEDTKNKIIDLRLFGIYGKYENENLRFISYAICRVINNLPVCINQNVVFDYLYVNDLVNIIKIFIEKKIKYKSYNIGTGKSIDLVSIFKRIQKITGKDIELKIKVPGLNNEYTCDINRFLSEFKNIKYTDMDVAIKEMYTWYENKIKSDDIK